MLTRAPVSKNSTFHCNGKCSWWIFHVINLDGTFNCWPLYLFLVGPRINPRLPTKTVSIGGQRAHYVPTRRWVQISTSCCCHVYCFSSLCIALTVCAFRLRCSIYKYKSRILLESRVVTEPIPLDSNLPDIRIVLNIHYTRSRGYNRH